MRIGKLTNQELQEIVISRLPRLSARTLTGAQVGADCAWINMDSNLLVTSADPVTAGGMQSGRLSIHVSCNDIAATGVMPVGILLVILAPPSIERKDLVKTIEQASEAASMLGVDIVGGHTEISDSVSRLVVITTAFGVIEKTDHVPLGKALPGDTLLMTKTAAIEGTWIAAMEHEDKISSALNAEDNSELLEQARSFIDRLSVVKEGVLAVSCPSSVPGNNQQGYPLSAVHLMHDATEGGIYGASYEMAELSGTGLILESTDIPVHPATKIISTALGLDPMRLISSGSLLIATSEPDLVIDKLKSNDVACAAIGKFTDDGFYVRDESGVLVPLSPPDVDEIYKL